MNKLYRYIASVPLDEIDFSWYCDEDSRRKFLERVEPLFFASITWEQWPDPDERTYGEVMLEWAANVQPADLEPEFSHHEIIELLSP